MRKALWCMVGIIAILAIALGVSFKSRMSTVEKAYYIGFHDGAQGKSLVFYAKPFKILYTSYRAEFTTPWKDIK